MQFKGIAAGLALTLALGFTSQANAAPAAVGLGDMKATASDASVVEKTYWTTDCRWHRGHRHCERVWVRPHGFVRPHAFWWGDHHRRHRYHRYSWR